MNTSCSILVALLTGSLSIGAQAATATATATAQSAATAMGMPTTATASAAASANAIANAGNTTTAAGTANQGLLQISLPPVSISMPGISIGSQAILQSGSASQIVLPTFPTQIVLPNIGGSGTFPGGVCSSSGQCFTPPAITGPGTVPGSVPPSGPGNTPGATCIRGGTCPGVTPGQPAIA